MAKGLNMQSVKSENRTSILYLLNKNGSLSRKEIASALGLTPAAVTKISAELMEQGMIAESGETRDTNHSGRREILLSLCLDKLFSFGVNAERDIITFSVTSLDGRLIKEKVIPFSSSLETVLHQARLFFNTECAEYRSAAIGLGVCIIGNQSADDFGVWKDADIAASFEKAIGIKAEVENNVKAFALAEMLYGKNKELDEALFFKWGPGIGSAIVANGRIFTGNDSSVAEIGHYIVNVGGRLCRCGRFGCLETEAGEDSILRETGNKLSLDELLKNCDNDTMNIIAHKVNMVALALTNTATILNTENIVYFGSMFNNEIVGDMLKKQCLRYNTNFDGKRIFLSSLNKKSAYIGTTAVCAKKFFFEKEF